MTMINRAADIAPDNSATEAAPGIVRVDVKAVDTGQAQRPVLRVAREDLPQARPRHVPQHQVGR